MCFNIRKYFGMMILTVIALCSTSAFAIDAGLDIAPVRYYNPITNTTENFFPIGWYILSAGEDSDIAEVAAMGCNTIRIGDSGVNSISLLKHRMNYAQVKGLKVELAITKNLIAGVNRNNPSTYTGIAEFVNTFKHHPALLCWRLGDENTDQTAADVVEAVAVVKMLDPNRQVTQVFGDGLYWPADKTSYLPGTDIISFDCYKHGPNNAEFEGNSGYLAYCREWADAASDRDVSFLPCIQGIGVWGWRYPTLKEFRWDTFTAIATAGSRGAMYWAYCPTAYTPEQNFPGFITNNVTPVINELNAIKNAMCTGYNIGTVTISNSNLAKVLLHEDAAVNKYYLIVVNNSGSQISNINITLSGLPKAIVSGASATDLTSGTTKTITNLGGGQYRITDTFPKYDVNVYSIPVVD